MKPFNLEAAKAGAAICTRDGRKARLLAHDLHSQRPIAAAIISHLTGNRESVLTYQADGCHQSFREAFADLMMASVKKEAWINIYSSSFDGLNRLHSSRESADKGATPSRIACVRLEWEE